MAELSLMHGKAEFLAKKDKLMHMLALTDRLDQERMEALFARPAFSGKFCAEYGTVFFLYLAWLTQDFVIYLNAL